MVWQSPLKWKLKLGLISGEPTLRFEKGGMPWSLLPNCSMMLRSSSLAKGWVSSLSSSPSALDSDRRDVCKHVLFLYLQPFTFVHQVPVEPQPPFLMPSAASEYVMPYGMKMVCMKRSPSTTDSSLFSLLSLVILA